MEQLPLVGISYSWNEENPNHKKKVELLAQKLIECDINITADFYDYEPTHDLYYFMEGLIHKTDYLLFICESSSKIKADSYKGQLGVKEVPQLRALLNDPKQTKVVPVIFEKDASGIPIKPNFLSLYYGFDLSMDNDFSSGNFDELVKFIKGIRNKKPANRAKSDSKLDEEQGLPVVNYFKGRRIRSYISQRTQKVVENISLALDVKKGRDFSETKPLAIIASSGEGKTTAVIEFCFKYAKRFSSLFWIDCSSDVDSQFLEIACDGCLGLYPKESDFQQADIGRVKKEVLKYINEHNCLVVFDNISSYKQIVEYMPVCGASRVLVTSTNFSLKANPEIELLEFQSMDDEDSYNILVPSTYQDRILDGEKEKYIELCHLLENMPFALEIASEYIQDYFELGIDCFIDELKVSSVRWDGLLSNDKRGSMNKSSSLIALIEKRVDQVASDGAVSSLLSLLGAAKIAGYDLKCSVFEDILQLDKKSFLKIKNNLSSNGICEAVDEKFLIHSLFLEYIVLFLTKSEHELKFGDFLRRECDKSRDAMFQTACWIMYEKERNGLKLICGSLLKRVENFNIDLLIPLLSCIWADLNTFDENRVALEYIDKAISLAEKDRKVNPEYYSARKFSLLYQKAITLHKMGNYSGAQSIYIDVLKNRIYISNSIMINALFYCGHLDRINGTEDRALIWYEDALNIIEDVKKDFADETTQEESELFLVRAYNYLRAAYEKKGSKVEVDKYTQLIEGKRDLLEKIHDPVRFYFDYDFKYSNSLKPPTNLGLRIVLTDGKGNFKML